MRVPGEWAAPFYRTSGHLAGQDAGMDVVAIGAEFAKSIYRRVA